MVDLATSILALSPRNYWKLDETSGTFFTDYGSTPVAMQWSGPTPQGAIGPEIGSHAARIFTGTLVSSAGLGLAAWNPFSLMAMVTLPADNTPTVMTDFMGIGDPANTATRGFRMQQFSANVGNEQIRQVGYNGLNGTSLSFPYPQPLWHNFALTYVPNNMLLYVDGGAPTQMTWNITLAPVAGDAVWVKSTARLVIAHLAFWTRVLSQGEIQTVSNQIAPWPYGAPINVPASGGGGGTVALNPSDPVIIAQSDLSTRIYAAVHRDYPQHPA